MKPAWNVLCTSPTTQRKIGLRRILSTSALTAGFLLHGGITPWNMPSAQAAESAQAAATSDIEEVVVTGSRIVRDGYEAPTPLTVVTAEALQQNAATNIAEAMHSIPAFSGSTSPQSGTTSVSASGAGLNLLNLRSLGANRTLILVDGQRTVAARVDAVVDINTIPQQLVSRVDIVTGGASAIYGSDAVTGVVNFVLDKTFTGIKGEVSGGVTTYGDDRSYKVALTAGTAFGGGRGHVIFSGELVNKDGVLGNYRPWNMNQYGVINNTAANIAAGQPQRLVRYGVDSWFTRGGTIQTPGPLKGITFGPGGVPYQFNFGSITDTAYTAGGDSRLGTIRNDTGSRLPARQLRRHR
jgi:iron complex outermembrane receptor protein